MSEDSKTRWIIGAVLVPLVAAIVSAMLPIWHTPADKSPQQIVKSTNPDIVHPSSKENGNKFFVTVDGKQIEGADIQIDLQTQYTVNWRVNMNGVKTVVLRRVWFSCSNKPQETSNAVVEFTGSRTYIQEGWATYSLFAMRDDGYEDDIGEINVMVDTRGVTVCPE